jgi:ankyrin repeat protein
LKPSLESAVNEPSFGPKQCGQTGVQTKGGLVPDQSASLPRALPDRPDLRHLKDQAWDLLRSGSVESLAEAQFQIAREYGFTSWPLLKEHVESLHEMGMLKHAIDTNDLGAVRTLMARNPALHTAPLGYGKNGPLSWVAECRIPWEPPGPARLAIAQWMIDHGSDVHQGGDGPLMRAALYDHRIPMMDLLVRNGADVNAHWNGGFPVICASCETVQPRALRWLLDHGASPVFDAQGVTNALDYLLGTYVRSAQLGACIEILLRAGCTSQRAESPVLDLLRGRLDLLKAKLEADPGLTERRFARLDFGNTGGRRLLLVGATLLHVAAEFGNVKAAQLLLAHGAQTNIRADVDSSGIGGQTPIFHAATQFGDFGLEMTQYLVDSGAELGVRAKLPGHYERLEEFPECTPLGYAELFAGTENRTVTFLRGIGAPV